TRWTTHIRRLDPSLSAADHARHDDGQRPVLFEPAPDGIPQNIGEIAVFDGQDAAGLLDLIENNASGIGEIGAEIGRAPVDSNQARFRHKSKTIRTSGFVPL